MKNHNPSQKTTTSKQSPESSFVNSKKPNHHHTKNHATMDGVHTNQFIDKHTVEFSKIRRAPEEPLARRLGGNLRKLTGPPPWASNRIRLVSAARPLSVRRAARGDEEQA
jgi:hypothetical protein